VELGVAAVKALFLARFAILGRVAGVGTPQARAAFLPATLRAACGTLLLLVLLTGVEEVAAGILLPYLALRQFEAALAEDAMQRLMRGGGN
jgi:hypothetical protein